MKGEIHLKLNSDTCIGTGESSAGIVDTEIQCDKYGIPYIPAKRIKGILREEAMSLTKLGKLSEELVNILFGTPGNADSGAVWIGNGYIEQYKDNIKCLERKRNELRGISDAAEQLLSKNNVFDAFTTIRAQTAINENGVADENSLRMTRVVQKKNKFCFPVTINIPTTYDNTGVAEEATTLLKDAVKCIRHIGTNRNRGYGWVSCYWKDCIADIDSIDTDILSDNTENAVLRYRIKLLSDCIFNEQYISGSTIRGMIATEYLNNSKQKRTEVCNDEAFSDMFIRDIVSFSNAYPCIDNKVAIPMPLCLMCAKREPSELYNHIHIEEPDTDLQYVRPDYSFGLLDIDDNTVTPVRQQTATSFHHKRSSDRSIGNAIEDGEFYPYDAVISQTEFAGEIIGPEKYISYLKKLLHNREVFIGKSRSAQYGHCCIIVDNFEYVDYKVDDFSYEDNIWPLLFLSDVLIMSSYGMPTCSPDIILEEIKYKTNVTQLEINKEKTIINTTYSDGFNVTWRMPKPVQRCIAKGSIIALDVSGIDTAERKNLYEKINNIKIGHYNSIGLGKIQIIPIRDIEIFKVVESEPALEYYVSDKEESKAFTVFWKKILKKQTDSIIKDIIIKQTISLDYFNSIYRFLKKGSTSKSIIKFLQSDMLKDAESFKTFVEKIDVYSERNDKRSDKKDTEEDKPYKFLKKKIGDKDTAMKAVRTWLNLNKINSPALKLWTEEFLDEDDENQLFVIYKLIMTQICIKVLREDREKK